MEMQHALQMDLSGSLKFSPSDDDFSTSAENMNSCADFSEMSSSEDSAVGQRGLMMMPSMGGVTMMSPSAMTVPVQAMATPQGAVQMPTCAMPMSPQSAQMYCLTVGPDGQQMLMPVSATQMPTWGVPRQTVSPQNTFPESSTALPEFPTPVDKDSTAGSLEARAAALSAYAAEVKAEARKAKAAAAAAARHRGRGNSETAATKTEKTSSDITPRWADMADQSQLGFHMPQVDDNETIPDDDRTTLMFRNLPNNYNRSTLLHMLDSEGFKATYNLVYLPTDFRNFAGFGYAFVNFVTHEDAKRAKASFQGFARWRVPSRKTCDVVWSGPVQGLQAHTERYRNSPVMHDSVPDEYKPAVFVDGVRVPFPAPTKRIRPPRVRRNSAGEGGGIAAPVAEHSGHAKRTGRGKVQ